MKYKLVLINLTFLLTILKTSPKITQIIATYQAVGEYRYKKIAIKNFVMSPIIGIIGKNGVLKGKSPFLFLKIIAE